MGLEIFRPSFGGLAFGGTWAWVDLRFWVDLCFLHHLADHTTQITQHRSHTAFGTAPTHIWDSPVPHLGQPRPIFGRTPCHPMDPAANGDLAYIAFLFGDIASREIKGGGGGCRGICRRLLCEWRLLGEMCVSFYSSPRSV